MNKKMGRPKLEIIKNRQIAIRYTEEQYQILLKKAKENKKTITDYIRDKSLTK